jgi:hypothetical protein
MKITFFKGCTVVLLGFIISILFACDPNDPVDPAPPPPPPPPPPPLTRVDTLIGTYNGECIVTESYMDFMTGQQIIMVDTLMHEILLLDIDTIGVTSYHFQFEGTYFHDHSVGATEFEQDTLTMHFLFGTHNENISIIPAEGLIITRDQHSNPSGFGTTVRTCRCQKPL